LCIGVGAQSTLGGGHKICIKNHQNAQILNDSCPKNYYNILFFNDICPKKNIKIPEFL